MNELFIGLFAWLLMWIVCVAFILGCSNKEHQEDLRRFKKYDLSENDHEKDI